MSKCYYSSTEDAYCEISDENPSGCSGHPDFMCTVYGDDEARCDFFCTADEMEEE